MNWHEFCDLVDWMTARWPDMVRWSDQRIRALWDDLNPWPTNAITRAVRIIYENGGRLPTGGQIIKTCRDLGYQPATVDTAHRHVWGIVEWEDDRGDGMRLAQCAICKTEKLYRPTEEAVL